MYKNVVDILSTRLRNQNFLVQMLRDKTQELEAKLQSILHLKDAGAPDDNAFDVPLEDSNIIKAFYRSIGSPSVSSEQRNRDHPAYQSLRQQGYSDNQVQQVARWTAKNVQGAKEVTLVKYCMDEALKE